MPIRPGRAAARIAPRRWRPASPAVPSSTTRSARYHPYAADPRVASAHPQALGVADTVVNVGAGAGVPNRPPTIAVEPSATMVALAAPLRAGLGHAPAIPRRRLRRGAGHADRAPLARSRSRAGELARVTRDRVSCSRGIPTRPASWLVDEYFPEIGAIDRPMPPGENSACSGSPRFGRSVPHDCPTASSFDPLPGDASRHAGIPIKGPWTSSPVRGPSPPRSRRRHVARRHADLLDRTVDLVLPRATGNAGALPRG